MDELLQAGHFEPHIGKVFEAEGEAAARLTLTSIELGPELPGAARRPFLLIFSGPRAPDLLATGIHRFTIEDGVALEVYVEPVQTFARDRQDYQAAFN